MNRAKWAGLFVAIVTLGNTTPKAASVPYQRCDIRAFLNSAPEGTNVRSQASASASKLRTIPDFPAGEVHIRGYQAGWFQVDHIWTPENLAPGVKAEDVPWNEANNPKYMENLFRGVGWVHASQLSLGVASDPNPRLYAGPSRRSRPIKKLGPDDDLDLMSCSGSWAKGRVDGVVGWLPPELQCSSPLTNCS